MAQIDGAAHEGTLEPAQERMKGADHPGQGFGVHPLNSLFMGVIAQRGQENPFFTVGLIIQGQRRGD